MRFHSLHLGSRYEAVRNKDWFEIAITLGGVGAIVTLLIAGSRLLVSLLTV